MGISLLRRVKLLPRSLQGFFRLGVILLAIFALVKLYFVIFSTPIIIDDRYMRAARGGESDASTSTRRVEVETACSPTTKLCYSVIDLIEQAQSDDDAGTHVKRVFPHHDRQSETVRRAIYVRGFSEEYDSIVSLIAPIGMSSHNSDTRMWSVNHTVVYPQYVAWMALSPFIVGSLDSARAAASTGAMSSMMIIGLGGGSLDGYLHTRFPRSVNITVIEVDATVKRLAHRWFGVVDDSTRRTVIKDGLLAFRDAESSGEQYDAIIVDACDSSSKMPCPPKEFISSDALVRAKHLLKPMGVLVLNLLPLESDEFVESVQHRLLSVFPTCLRMRFTRELNIVLSCLPYSLEARSVEPTKGIWAARQSRLVREFGFERLLENTPGATLITTNG